MDANFGNGGVYGLCGEFIVGECAFGVGLSANSSGGDKASD